MSTVEVEANPAQIAFLNFVRGLRGMTVAAAQAAWAANQAGELVILDHTTGLPIVDHDDWLVCRIIDLPVKTHEMCNAFPEVGYDLTVIANPACPGTHAQRAVLVEYLACPNVAVYEHWSWDSGAETMAHPWDPDLPHPFGNANLNDSISEAAPASSGYIRPGSGTLTSGNVDAVAADVYRVQIVWARAVSPDVRWQVQFLDSGGAILQSTTIYSGSPAGGTWITTNSPDLTAPTNTERMTLRKDSPESGLGMTCYVDDVTIWTVS